MRTTKAEFRIFMAEAEVKKKCKEQRRVNELLEKQMIIAKKGKGECVC